MRKILQIFGWDWHKEYKYLLLKNSPSSSISGYVSDHYFYSFVFETKKEALDYLNNDVAKNQRSQWKLYKVEEPVKGNSGSKE